MSQDDNKPTDLLFDKHIEYVVNHGNDKNDFASVSLFRLQLTLINFNSFDFLGIHNDRVSANERHLLGHDVPGHHGSVGEARQAIDNRIY